jgi:hypothetical protein
MNDQNCPPLPLELTVALAESAAMAVAAWHPPN